MSKKDYEEFERFLLKCLTLRDIIEKEEKDKFKIMDIDSKKKQGYRYELFKKYENKIKKREEYYKNIIKKFTQLEQCKNKEIKLNKSSYLKGDILYEGNKKNIIIDAKDYKKIEGRMKFPSKYLNYKDNFIKTIDSNIKHLILLPFIHEIKEIKLLLCKLSNKEEIKESDIKNNSFSISKKQFMEMFKLLEYGYMYDILNITGKYIISNDKNNETVLLKNITNFLNISKKINVKIEILDKNYIYINFFNNTELFYSISQRSFEDGYRANCSFINTKYLNCKIINKKKLNCK